MSALSDALNEANVHRWSSRDIQRRSGDRINHATVAKYLNGSHGKPTESVLVIFSEVFGLPLQRLRRLAGLPSGERTPYEPPAEADRLNARQRRAVNELIRLLADTTEEAGGELDQRSAPIATDPSRARPRISDVVPGPRPPADIDSIRARLQEHLERATTQDQRQELMRMLSDLERAQEAAEAEAPSAAVVGLSEARPRVPEKRVARKRDDQGKR